MGIVPTPESDRARFWVKVDKHGPVPETQADLGSCWLWTAAVFSNGYGAFRPGSKQRRAHVVSFEWHIGPTSGLSVLHHCDVRRCVNPAHLFLGTQKDNIQDAVSKGRMATGKRSGMHTRDLATLTDDQVKEIHALCAGGAPQWAIAEQYGVSQTLISHILTGKTWGHLGLPTIRTREHKPRPSAETIRVVRQAGALGVPYREIGENHGLSASAVWRIVRRLAYPEIED